MSKKIYVTVNEDGLFCLSRKFRGETERMAYGREHLKEEAEAMGAELVCVDKEREYGIGEL